MHPEAAPQRRILDRLRARRARRAYVREILAAVEARAQAEREHTALWGGDAR